MDSRVSLLCWVLLVSLAPGLIFASEADPLDPMDEMGYRVSSGSYVGDGNVARGISGIGFRPDLVIITMNGTRPSVARTSSMSGDRAKRLGTTDGLKSGCILSLDADGFTVGNDNDVNQSTKTYYWVAFHAAAGHMVLGTYTGNGIDNRQIAGLGLQPGYVIVLGEGSVQAQHRVAASSSNYCVQFNDQSALTDRIQNFSLDAFEVGRNDDVNASGAMYHYIVWAQSAGVTYSGAYTGNGSDNRNITAPGLEPAFVLVRVAGGSDPAVCRSAAMAGDFTLPLDGGTNFSNGIQGLRSDGFQIGSNSAVNSVLTTYYFVAFRNPPGADLSVAMEVDRPTPAEGDTVTYAVTLQNLGPDAVSACSILDQLPAGVTYLSHSASQGNYASGSGSWNVGACAAGAGASLTLKARVNPGTAGTTITNSAAVSSSNKTDPNPANNSASAAIAVQSADLALAMSFEPATPEIGQSVTIRTSLANLGPNAATGATVTDLLPAGLEYVSHSVSQGAYTTSTGEWSAGGLALGTTATLDLTARVLDQPDGTIVTNSAAITWARPTDPNVANNSSSVSIPVLDPTTDLSITMSVDSPTPDVGESATFTLTLSNAGPREASGIRVRSLLPSGLTYGSSSASQGTYASGTGLWDAGALDVGTTATLTLTGLVTASAAGSTVTHTATIEESEPADANPDDNSASASVLVPAADLSLTLSADDLTPDYGQLVTFTLTVTNQGPNDASGVAILDLLPTELAYFSATASQGSYTAGSGLWSIENLNTAASATLTLKATLGSGGGLTSTNTASISAATQYDPVPANNAATVLLTVPSADLGLALQLDTPHPNVGAVITYTLTLTNHGPATGTAITVSDPLPAGLTYLAHLAGAGSYTPQTGLWTLTSIAPGNAVALSLSARVSAEAGGMTITNSAVVTAAHEVDPQSSNNLASIPLTVQSSDLALAMSADPPTPNEGEAVTYTITASNLGPDTASGVVVVDQLPAGLGYASNSTTHGSYAEDTGRWTIGTLNTGADAVLHLVATVDAGLGGTTVTNVASIAAADQFDPDAGNDGAAAIIAVGGADLEVDLSVNDATPDEGEAITYTVLLSNHGPNRATGVLVSIPLTPGLAQGSSSPSQGSFDPATSTWSVGAINQGAVASLTLAATVQAGTGGSSITRAATIGGSDTADPIPQNNDDETTIAVRSADLALVATVDLAQPELGEQVTFTVGLSNLGPNEAGGAAVEVVLPPGLQFVSAQAALGTYQSGTGLWTLGSLGVAQSTQLAITILVASGAIGETMSLSTAIISSVTADPSSGNNSAVAEVMVQAPASELWLTADPQSETPLLPGGTRPIVFRLRAENRSEVPAIVEELTVTNASIGPGLPAQLDEEWTTLRLSVSSETAPASTATAVCRNGSATFSGLNLTIGSGADAIFEIEAGASLRARDGDRLDLEIDEGALIFTGPVRLQSAWPISPAGSFPIDGMTSAQVAAGTVPGTELFAGDTLQLVFDLTVPPNGYETDRLQALRLRNLGDAQSGREIAALRLWADGGDRIFQGAHPDDRRLGFLTWTGALWSLTGLDEAIPSAGLRLFVSVDVAETALEGRTIRLALPATPQEGLWLASGNDGPIDTEIANEGTQTILAAAGDVVSIAAEPQSGVTLLPGGAAIEVLQLRLVNFTRQSERLRGITFRNASSGPGSLAELDADWTPLTLTGSVGGTPFPAPLGQVTFFNGSATLNGLDVELPPRQTVVLSVLGGASLQAHEPDLLDLEIEEGEITLAGSSHLETDWPINPFGAFRVDGFAAAQATLHPISAGNLDTGASRNLIFDVALPANGYAADLLQRFGLANLGTAAADADIERMELWGDGGDGRFDPGSDRRIGAMVFTGDRWEITGRSEPVPIDGIRLFVSADISELAAEGRTIRMGLPASSDLAVGFASGNDGPRDAALEEPSTLVITSRDRLTVAAKSLASPVLHPGDRDVLLLQLIVTNTHEVPRALQSLTLTNLATGPGTPDDLDAEYDILEVHADGDEDGRFTDDETDPTVATGAFSGGRATLSGFSWEVGPHESRHLFVTASVSLRGARDGDELGLGVREALDLFFRDQDLVSGAWPLDSGARGRIDGMVPGQVVDLSDPVATLGPGQGSVLALDVLIPSNGYEEDFLEGLVVRNTGTATPAQIDRLELWRDGGDGLFSNSRGDDIHLGLLQWSRDAWISSALHEPLPLAGGRFFVSLDVAGSLSQETTVGLSIPTGGISVASENDGPVTEAVGNAETILLSPAPLLSTLTTEPSASTTGEPFLVRMSVVNAGDETIQDIVPSILLTEGEGGILRVQGPTPATLDLTPGARDTLTWTYVGTAVGATRLRAHAAGTGAVSGAPQSSLDSYSGDHQVLAAAGNLEMFAAGAPPFSVSRGQTDVVPLTLTFRNPGTENGSSIKLTDLRVRLEDEAGAPIVPSELLTRISVREGNRVYLTRDAASLQEESAEIPLPLTTPAIVSTLEPSTLSLFVDISDTTRVRAFRFSVAASGWLHAEDVTSHAPVAVLLQGQGYPVRSGVARIVEEATEVLVSPLTAEPVRVVPGQGGVPLFSFRFENPGIEGITSDARVGSVALAVTDSLGVPLADPGRHFGRLRLRTAMQDLIDFPVPQESGDSLTIVFVNALTLPVNAPVTVTVVGDVAAAADVGSLRIRLLGSSAVDARDANTRRVIPVRYLTPAVESPLLRIERPAESLRARAVSFWPSSLAIGTEEADVFDLILRHPDLPGTARLRVDSLLVSCRNEHREAELAGSYLTRASVWMADREVGRVTSIPNSQSALVVPLDPVWLEPGDSTVLRVRVSIRVSAPASFLELLVGSDQVIARDANRGTRVPVRPEDGTEFPLVSGPAQLRSPPRELQVGLESLLGASLAGDGRAYPAARLTFINPAEAGAGAVEIAHLTVRAADGSFQPLSLGEVAARLSGTVSDQPIEVNQLLTAQDQTGVLQFAPPLRVEAGSTTTLELTLETKVGGSLPEFRLGCGGDDVGIIQPAGALLTIETRPAPGATFPLWSEPAGFAATTLDESYANFPNPFAAGREGTTFLYYLPAAATVTLRLWTLRGEPVITLLTDTHQPPGLHQGLTWDGRNGRGEVVINGVYVADLDVRFEDGSRETLRRKVAVLR